MDWLGLVVFLVIVGGFMYYKGIGPFKKKEDDKDV